MKWRQKRIDFKEKILDSISPSYCAAKWSQVTIHLGSGHTHSCHHPRTHLIPLEEIKRSPSALHNTSFKIEQRLEMLNGKRPTECEYCWQVEDRGDVLSDRVLKSYEPWSKDRISDLQGLNHVNPSYLEISFSNVCNFKCSYCSPDVSSKWMEEIEKFGAYPTSQKFNNIEWIKTQNKMPFLERDLNPYVEAFWQWWPELYPTLHTFRITGGEPLMTKHTFRVLDYIIEHPNPELELGINSNLCVPEKLIDEFIEKIQQIQIAKAVKNVVVYTSCEAYGDQAEYIRYGMNYKQWLSNCDRYLSSVLDSQIHIMSTYNLLSVISYQQFLEDILILKRKHCSFRVNTNHSVYIDIPYLNYPSHQVVGLLSEEFINNIQVQINFMKDNINKDESNRMGFVISEVEKLQRVLTVFESKIKNGYPEKEQFRKDFVKFVDEHDRRRGTNFKNTFPELVEFYNACKEMPAK
jgi:organic radical activating enzyme